MRLMVTGCRGQVGWELTRSLAVLGEVIACDRNEADLTHPASLKAVVDRIRPDVIVNAAAYTMVDKAEDEEALAVTINAEAVRALAQASRDVGALFVHYSTEYVFDGMKSGAYVETDAPNPINAYGRSKLTGEQAVADAAGDWLVFRTSWVYAARGKNFLRTMLRLASERETLRVVADQVGAPTSARMIAELTAHAIRQAMGERASGRFESGLFHLTASGSTTWRGFASRIVDAARALLPPDAVATRAIEAIATSEYPTPARRQANSVLDNGKFERRFGLRRAPWDESMQRVLEEIVEQGGTRTF
ncbi:dTDP-4-dehydrorhamnose reductase [Trinickia dinghuensis]|uniref:dTDP-4-dehydrorhamnose reductase n=1 Tax=Trinickia dinghuensis TaxID=2291023 RepID=A0A3D8JUG7_9BURK|nr:dTDP-4-dehydrorhamnose reductase [Trinickia dinghuensis]RDU96031.1 dTDP-4-dehydrorhamnose reductase [Trinickia dinghuensis]